MKKKFKIKNYFIVFVAFLFMIFGVNSVGAYSSDIDIDLNEAIQLSILIEEDTDFVIEEYSTDEMIVVVEEGFLKLWYEGNFYGSYDLKDKVFVMSIYKQRIDEGDDPQNDVYIKYSWYSPSDYYNTTDHIDVLFNYYDANIGYFNELVFNGYSNNYPINYNYFIQNYRDFRELPVYAINRDSITYIGEHLTNFGIDDYDSVYNIGYEEGYRVGFDEGVVSVELGNGLENFGSFGKILLNSVGNFLSFEIVPNFSLLNVLQLVMTICLVIILLKFFAGG